MNIAVIFSKLTHPLNPHYNQTNQRSHTTDTVYRRRPGTREEKTSISGKLEAKKNNRRRHHEPINQDQKPKMQSPIPLKLTKITLRWLLIMNLKILPHFIYIIGISTATNSHLQLPQPFSGQPKSQFVAPSLVLESIDAPQGLSHRHVED